MKDDVRCFVEIVRQGSYAAASKELGVSAATLTRRITGLEERLGVRLLDRTPRLCRPTADGEVFYERCEAILDDMGAAEEEMRVRGGRPVGRLRVAAPISFGRRHLAPLIGEFHSLHPEVQVELELTDETDLLRQESYDVSVEIGRPDRGDTISRLLLESPRVVCASPGYLERHGRPERPADLLEHRCLHLIRDGRRLGLIVRSHRVEQLVYIPDARRNLFQRRIDALHGADGVADLFLRGGQLLSRRTGLFLGPHGERRDKVRDHGEATARFARTARLDSRRFASSFVVWNRTRPSTSRPGSRPLDGYLKPTFERKSAYSSKACSANYQSPT
mgnify:CR=1 FL=1